MSAWIEVKALVGSAPDDWSLLIEAFRAHGCENTLQEDDPPALTSAVVAVEGADRVIAELTASLLRAGAASVATRPFEEENWDEVWKQFFHPRAIGRRLLIRPSWEAAPPHERLEIVLDPGQAFGTGDHPTTRLCLGLLEDAIAGGERVADVGCGSGVLAIAARKLGAASVVGVDIEPLSVEIARRNALANGVDCEFFEGTGMAAITGRFDLVVSNIISAVLIRIAPEVGAAMRLGGRWILSGVIPENWPDVLAAAESAGFSLLERVDEDGWLAALLTKEAKV